MKITDGGLQRRQLRVEKLRDDAERFDIFGARRRLAIADWHLPQTLRHELQCLLKIADDVEVDHHTVAHS